MKDYQLKVRDRHLSQFITESQFNALQPALRNKYEPCPVYHTQESSFVKAFVRDADVSLQQSELDQNQKYEDLNKNEL